MSGAAGAPVVPVVQRGAGSGGVLGGVGEIGGGEGSAGTGAGGASDTGTPQVRVSIDSGAGAMGAFTECGTEMVLRR